MSTELSYAGHRGGWASSRKLLKKLVGPPRFDPGTSRTPIKLSVSFLDSGVLNLAVQRSYKNDYRRFLKYEEAPVSI